MFITAIRAGSKKLMKYFPRRLEADNIHRYKPFIFAIFLDPRLKTGPFRQGRQLYFSATTETEVYNLVKEEFLL